MRKLVKSSRKRGESTVNFDVSNSFFKSDPFYGQKKALALLWRIKAKSDIGSVYSALQTIRKHEGESVSISLEEDLPVYEPPSEPRPVYIMDATYCHLNVTSQVQEITSSGTIPQVSSANSEFGQDPCYGTVKVLSVTYTYHAQPEDILECHTKTAREGDMIMIPPLLKVHCATWAGTDITDILRGRVTCDQTLPLYTKLISSPDPWYGVLKTISVLYQYGNAPMQLYITTDGKGTPLITSTQPSHTNGMFTSHNQPWEDFRIAAVVWGERPVDENAFLQAAAETGHISCTNEFFRRDGLPNWPKTCQVFFESKSTGEIRCRAAREGEMLKIPTLFEELP